MVHRLRDGRCPDPVEFGADALRTTFDGAVRDFDLRGAAAVVRDLVDDTNRRVDATRPWELARDSEELDRALGELVARARVLGELLDPVVPDLSARVLAALTPDGDGRLATSIPLVRRFDDAS